MKARKTLKKIGLIALLSAASLFSKNAYSQEFPEIKIRGNSSLEYFADGVGNQNGKVEALEADYMKEKFEKSDTLFVCTATPTSFYSGMKKIYASFADAWKYWCENPVRGPQAIVGFDKEGKITEAYRIGDGFSVHKVFNLPDIDYKRVMENRLKKYIESLD